jgi:hypothetical protein
MELDNLFKWKDSYVVKDPEGNPIRGADGDPLVVYLRIIGDNDATSARRYSLKYSAKLRKEYEKEIAEIIPDLEVLSTDELASMLVINEVNEIYKQAERETRIKYPVEPQDLSLKEDERYNEETDTYFDRLQSAVVEQAQKITEERRQYYQSMDRQRLIHIVKQSYLNKILEAEAQKAYEDAILYYCCFDDAEYEEKSFSSIDAAANATSFLKEQLISAYNKLTLQDKELKK